MLLSYLALLPAPSTIEPRLSRCPHHVFPSVKPANSQPRTAPPHPSTVPLTSQPTSQVWKTAKPSALAALRVIEQLRKDPEIVTPVHGGMAWVLKCQASVYDLTYTWLNSTIRNPDLTLSNASVGGLIAAPTNHDFALPSYEIAAKVASFSPTAQELANKWANLFSQTALGLSVGVLSPRPNILEQSRTEKLVARVPKAPLFVLVILNLVYAALGLVLAVYGLFSGVKSGTGAARQRLTVPGVVAECFEDQARARPGRNKVEECFAEKGGNGYSRRLGVGEAADGGTSFVRYGYMLAIDTMTIRSGLYHDVMKLRDYRTRI